MTSTNFLKSLTITAAALGSKFGVPVYVGGQTACTDGRSIRLPDVEGIETIGRNEILGYLVHECGHIRFTNMTSTGDTPLEHSLVNALEDVRIDHERANVYGGARALLFDLHKPLLASLSAKANRFLRALGSTSAAQGRNSWATTAFPMIRKPSEIVLRRNLATLS